MSVSYEDMEGYARDCVRLAQLAQNSELREQLMQMAREWMAAAMHESTPSITISPLKRTDSARVAEWHG
jgi:hypothetical protein